MSTNFLAPEAAIIERLGDLLPADPDAPADNDVLDVRSIADAADVSEQTMKYRTVHVLYDGYRIVEARRDGAIRMETRWLVILAIRNAKGHARKTGVRSDAGPILNRIIAKLSGWKPTQAHSQMQIANAQRPGYTPAFGYFPLGFTTTTTFYPDEETSQ